MNLTQRLARAALITTLAGAAGLSLAQGAASPAKKELAQKILQQQQSSIEQLARAMTEQSIAPLVQQAGAVLQSRVPPEQREALGKEVQGDLRKFGDDVVPLVRDRALKLAPTTIGPMLEEKLSEDELKQVLAALESPGFRKYMQVAPEMQRALTQKLVAELQPQIEPKIKALEQTLSKRFSAAVPNGGAASGAGSKAAAPAGKASGAKK